MASQDTLCFDCSFDQNNSLHCNCSSTKSGNYMCSENAESYDSSISSLTTDGSKAFSNSDLSFITQNQIPNLEKIEITSHSNTNPIPNKNSVNTSVRFTKCNSLPLMQSGKESFNVDHRTSLRVPLDSGLECWIIAISCSWINALLFGIYRSYALIYPKLIDEYGLSRGDATWPFSLCMSMIHLAGPLSSGLSKWLSTRTIYLLGCILSTGSLVACKYLPDISSLIIQIGLVQGIGIGFTPVQNLVILNEYFDRKRGLANGISMAGGTVGAFFVSPLLEFSLKHLGLADSYLMLALLCSLTLPAVLLLRQNRTSSHNSIERMPTVFSVQSLSNTARNSSSRISSVLSKHHKSVQLSPMNTLESTNKSLSICLTSFNHFPSESRNTADDYKFVNKCCLDADFNTEPSAKNLMHSTTYWLKHRFQQFKFYLKQKSKISDSTMDLTPESKITKPINDNSFFCQLQTIFSSVYFYLILATHLSYFFGVISFNMVVADLVADNGIGSSASPMITAFAFGDLIGRVSSGWFVDKSCCCRSTFSMVCTFMTAIFLKWVTLTPSYWTLFIISISLGMLSGSIVITIPIQLCEHLGIQLVPIAFGLTSFCCGFTTLVRPALICYFRDEQGSYNGLFDLLGAFCVFCAALWLCQIVRQKMRKSNIEI